MKKYQVRIPPDVASFVRHLHPQLKARIRRALEELENDPSIGKALKDHLLGLYSYRVLNYRIIYQILKKEILIEIIEIAERKIVYHKVGKIWRSL